MLVFVPSKTVNLRIHIRRHGTRTGDGFKIPEKSSSLIIA